jgi:TPP-dependent pyruvate/acetoin dehydrogenase alpha subunit
MLSITTDSLPTALGSLADPHVGHEPVQLGDHAPERLITWLERMILIRHAEEQVGELVTRREALCPCHLAIGQEACAVGVAAAFRAGDRAFGAHRSHGHYLALGGDIDAMFAEILGKATGCSGGMGGSMHLVAPAQGLLGTVPIVSTTIPMAVGAGLAAKLEGSGGVAVAFFGDGATEEGAFHEAMNLAATFKVPVIFACENNLFSSHLHISLRQPADCLARYAAAHRVAYEVLDGNDVCAVAEAAERAATRARAGEGPTFLELVTYRWRGHVGPSEDIDVGVKRGDELVHWKKRDPIRRLRQALIEAALLDQLAVDRLEATAAVRVRDAVATARAAPYPAPDVVYQHLFASRRMHGR